MRDEIPLLCMLKRRQTLVFMTRTAPNSYCLRLVLEGKALDRGWVNGINDGSDSIRINGHADQ